MGFVYDAALSAVIAIASPWLAWRSRAGRPGPWRLWKGPSFPKPSSGKPVVWFHGVSVGEIHLLGPVVAAFRQRHPELEVVVSSTTPTGLEEARKRFPDTVVSPFPFDLSWQLRSAFDSLRPAAVVLAESELWPGFLAEAEKRDVPVAIINGRMSPRSAGRWRMAGPLARMIMGRVHTWAVQDDSHRAALESLGIPPGAVRVTGSVKFDGASMPRMAQAEELRLLLGIGPGQTILVAGSTQECEERHLLVAWKNLAKTYPGLRLVLVPRHPERFDAVACWLAAEKVSFARRSRLTPDQPASEGVILLDTLGELGALWTLAHMGFVGGSLDGKRGGQSMIEPAARGVPACFGPHVWNFKDISRQLISRGGATMLAGPEQLEPTLRHWLENPMVRAAIGEAAKAFVATQQGATGRTLDFLDSRIPVLGGTATDRRAG
jgi:3-deoxy-D-manno-octulosonic-acid transferase